MEEYSSIENRGYFGVFYNYRYYNGFSYLRHTPDFSLSQVGRAKKHNVLEDDNIYVDTDKDYEAFQTIDLRFNYNLKNKWNFMVSLPFHYNTTHYDEVYPKSIGSVFDSTATVSGIGDLLIGALKVTIIETDTWKHQFKYGVALGLPTGNSEIRSSPNVSPTDPALLPGKGAVDGIIRFNYLGTLNETFGFQGQLLYAHLFKSTHETDFVNPNNIVGPSTFDYRFGNRFSSEINALYIFKIGRSNLIPRIGYQFNYAKYDLLNSRKVENTGGTVGLLNIGIDFKIGKILWRNTYNMPIHQNVSGEQILLAGKLSTGIVFSINTSSSKEN